MKKSTILLCRILELFGYSFQHQYIQAISQNTRLARSLTATLGRQAWKDASHCPEFADDVEIISHLDSRGRELTDTLQHLETDKQSIQAQTKNNRTLPPADRKQAPDSSSSGATAQQRTRLLTLLRELRDRRKNLTGVLPPDHTAFAKLGKQEEEYKQELARLEAMLASNPAEHTAPGPETPEAAQSGSSAVPVEQLKDITTRINTAKAEQKKIQQTLSSSYLHLGNAICHAWQTDKNIRRQLSRHGKTMALLLGVNKSIKKYERLVRTNPKARENAMQS